MYKINSTIEGIAPVLFNRVVTLKGGRGKPTPGQEEEAAKDRVYRNANGLYLPAANLKRALRIGSVRAALKIGRGSFEPYIRAAVFIEPPELEFGKDVPDFMLPSYVRIPPGTRGALIYKVRPGLNAGWKVSAVFNVFDDRIEEDKLKMALESAGLLIGVCDWRPEYGRFVVNKWEVSK
jgi:hypothetical protein